jgi:transposase
LWNRKRDHKPGGPRPELKAEAVRLVLDEGRSINDVAENLGVYHSSLTAWVKQAKIDRGKGLTGGLMTEERDELRRLRKEVRELKMEREILKKRRPSSRGKTRKVRVYPRGEGQFSDHIAVPSASRVDQRILCVGEAKAIGASRRKRSPHRRDQSRTREQPMHLR